MKKIFFAVMISVLVAAHGYAAEEERKASVLGEALDQTLSSFETIFSPYQYLDPIVVTPTRYADPSLKVANSVTVINERQIGASYAKYVPEVLKDEAGVVVNDLLGNGKVSRIDIRGFGDNAPQNVLVLVDGRRTNQVDLSGADMVQIDPAAIERIEVVRGPQSVLYGDNATAGVVNIITKSGAGREPEIDLSYDVGSYRYSAYKGAVRGGSTFLDYFVTASESYNNGYRINNHLETLDYTANVTMKPTDQIRLRTSASYHKDWYGLPGAVKPVDINSIGKRGSIAPDNRAKTEDYYYMVTPEITKDLGFGEALFSSDALFRSRRTNAIYYSAFGDVSNVHHIRTFGFTPKAAFTSELFGIKNRMLVGFDYYGSRDEIDSGVLSAMDSMVIDKKTAGLYATDTVELPFHLTLDGGFRSEWAYYRFDQQAVLQGKNEKKPNEYAYEAGITYAYNDRSSIYGKYARSFRFPTTEEWYSSLYVDYFSGLIAGGLNLALKPQVADNYEIGIKENSSRYITVNANYHLMDVKNELYYDSVSNQNTVHHHTVHHGLELETEVRILDSIRAFLNYTYQKAFFVGEAFAGNEIPLVPRHKLSTGFEYTYKDSVHLRYTITYVGLRRFANDLQNTMARMKAYMTHDIKLSYEKHGFEIYGAINNLFDEDYAEYGALDFTLTRPGYYPAPRMNVLGGVRYRF